MMTKKSLLEIREYLQDESQKWDKESKTDRQFFGIFKKIDDAINNNLYEDRKDRVAIEFQLQNKIREMNIIDVVEPLTKKFFKEVYDG